MPTLLPMYALHAHSPPSPMALFSCAPWSLWGVTGRYGPGLVIYWFGFVETLQSASSSMTAYQDIVVAEDLPSPIMLPTGQLV